MNESRGKLKVETINEVGAGQGKEAEPLFWTKGAHEKERTDEDEDEDKAEDEDEEMGVVEGKEAEITLPGRSRKLVTATGYSPTSDSGESNLGAKYKIVKMKNIISNICIFHLK